VLDAAGRMRQPVQKTQRLAVAGMRQRGGRQEGEGGGKREASAHGGFPVAYEHRRKIAYRGGAGNGPWPPPKQWTPKNQRRPRKSKPARRTSGRAALTDAGVDGGARADLNRDLLRANSPAANSPMGEVGVSSCRHGSCGRLPRGGSCCPHIRWSRQVTVGFKCRKHRKTDDFRETAR